MQTEIRGIHHYEITDEDKQSVAERFEHIGEQTGPEASLDVELWEEQNPSITDKMVCAATLVLKGETIRAKEAHPEMVHAIHHAAEDVRRQVKRHYEKQRGR